MNNKPGHRKKVWLQKRCDISFIEIHTSVYKQRARERERYNELTQNAVLLFLLRLNCSILFILVSIAHIHFVCIRWREPLKKKIIYQNHFTVKVPKCKAKNKLWRSPKQKQNKPLSDVMIEEITNGLCMLFSVMVEKNVIHT